MSTLLALLALAAAVGLWLEHLAAREAARRYCVAYCAKARVQLLDQTVSLRRWRPHWADGGLNLRRQFQFEFSSDGLGRRQGYLWLRGRVLEVISMEQEHGQDYLDP